MAVSVLARLIALVIRFIMMVVVSATVGTSPHSFLGKFLLLRTLRVLRVLATWEFIVIATSHHRVCSAVVVVAAANHWAGFGGLAVFPMRAIVMVATTHHRLLFNNDLQLVGDAVISASSNMLAEPFFDSPGRSLIGWHLERSFLNGLGRGECYADAK